MKDPVTEQPLLDSVEISNLINLRTHIPCICTGSFSNCRPPPVRRVRISAESSTLYLGPAAARCERAGWKDTVRADPGVVTRIIARFEGFARRYVWHCHLLEHEDNEMTRAHPKSSLRNRGGSQPARHRELRFARALGPTLMGTLKLSVRTARID